MFVLSNNSIFLTNSRSQFVAIIVLIKHTVSFTRSFNEKLPYVKVKAYPVKSVCISKTGWLFYFAICLKIRSKLHLNEINNQNCFRAFRVADSKSFLSRNKEGSHLGIYTASVHFYRELLHDLFSHILIYYGKKFRVR